MENADSNSAQQARGCGLPEGLLAKVREELTCVICYEVSVRPSTLPCGHTACRGCFNRALAAAASQPKCPSCRAPLPIGMPALALNTTLKSLAELLLPDECVQRGSATSTPPEAPRPAVLEQRVVLRSGAGGRAVSLHSSHELNRQERSSAGAGLQALLTVMEDRWPEARQQGTRAAAEGQQASRQGMAARLVPGADAPAAPAGAAALPRWRSPAARVPPAPAAQTEQQLRWPSAFSRVPDHTPQQRLAGADAPTLMMRVLDRVNRELSGMLSLVPEMEGQVRQAQQNQSDLDRLLQRLESLHQRFPTPSNNRRQAAAAGAAQPPAPPPASGLGASPSPLGLRSTGPRSQQAVTPGSGTPAAAGHAGAPLPVLPARRTSPSSHMRTAAVPEMRNEMTWGQDGIDTTLTPEQRYALAVRVAHSTAPGQALLAVRYIGSVYEAVGDGGEAPTALDTTASDLYAALAHQLSRHMAGAEAALGRTTSTASTAPAAAATPASAAAAGPPSSHTSEASATAASAPPASLTAVAGATEVEPGVPPTQPAAGAAAADSVLLSTQTFVAAALDTLLAGLHLPHVSSQLSQAAIHECLASSLCVLANAALLPVNGSAQVQRSLSKLLDMLVCSPGAPAVMGALLSLLRAPFTTAQLRGTAPPAMPAGRAMFMHHLSRTLIKSTLLFRRRAEGADLGAVLQSLHLLLSDQRHPDSPTAQQQESAAKRFISAVCAAVQEEGITPHLALLPAISPVRSIVAECIAALDGPEPVSPFILSALHTPQPPVPALAPMPVPQSPTSLAPGSTLISMPLVPAAVPAASSTAPGATSGEAESAAAADAGPPSRAGTPARSTANAAEAPAETRASSEGQAARSGTAAGSSTAGGGRGARDGRTAAAGGAGRAAADGGSRGRGRVPHDRSGMRIWM